MMIHRPLSSFAVNKDRNASGALVKCWKDLDVVSETDATCLYPNVFMFNEFTSPSLKLP